MPNYRCPKCDKEIIEYVRFNKWLHLNSFIEFLYSEGNITQVTYEAMSEDILHLRPEEVDECLKCDLLKEHQKNQRTILDSVDEI